MWRVGIFIVKTTVNCMHLFPSRSLACRVININLYDLRRAHGTLLLFLVHSWVEREWEREKVYRDNVNNCQSNTKYEGMVDERAKGRGIRAYNLTYMPSVLKWGNKQAMNCKRRRFSIVMAIRQLAKGASQSESLKLAKRKWFERNWERIPLKA